MRAILGVYLIAKTDMSATLHALAFAMACGFAWRPVLEGASALVEEQVALATETAIDESTEAAVSFSEGLEGADGGDQGEGLDTVVSDTVDALRHDPRKTSTAELRSVRLEGVVQNIKSASGIDAEERIDGLRKIGEAASAAGDYSLAAISMSAIAEVGGATNASTSVKDTASAAVAEIGHIGTMRRMPSLEVSSDVIQAALKPREGTSATEIFKRRFPSQALRRP